MVCKNKWLARAKELESITKMAPESVDGARRCVVCARPLLKNGRCVVGHSQGNGRVEPYPEELQALLCLVDELEAHGVTQGTSVEVARAKVILKHPEPQGFAPGLTALIGLLEHTDWITSRAGQEKIGCGDAVQFQHPGGAGAGIVVNKRRRGGRMDGEWEYMVTSPQSQERGTRWHPEAEQCYPYGFAVACAADQITGIERVQDDPRYRAARARAEAAWSGPGPLVLNVETPMPGGRGGGAVDIDGPQQHDEEFDVESLWVASYGQRATLFGGDAVNFATTRGKVVALCRWLLAEPDPERRGFGVDGQGDGASGIVDSETGAYHEYQVTQLGVTRDQRPGPDSTPRDSFVFDFYSVNGGHISGLTLPAKEVRAWATAVLAEYDSVKPAQEATDYLVQRQRDDPLRRTFIQGGYTRPANLWGEEPRYPRQDWQNEVADGNTNLGYWEWVVSQQEADGETEEPPAGAVEEQYAYPEDPWGEDPRYPRGDWESEAAAGDTNLGYWQWVENKLDQDGDQEADEPE